MRILKILSYIFVLLLAIKPSVAAAWGTGSASKVEGDTTAVRVRGIQFENAIDSLRDKKVPLLNGFSVSGDMAGAVMAAFSPFGQIETAARVNLKGRFFPTIEVGCGISNHTNETTSLHFKTKAPYFRVGCDYNFAKDIHGLGRILGGMRYGFSSFKYDLDGPDIEDSIWGTHTPFHFSNLNSNVHWAEFVFGMESKVWGVLHLGWSVRYRFRLSNKHAEVGQAWYVPGFGRNSASALSGTFNLIFDIKK